MLRMHKTCQKYLSYHNVMHSKPAENNAGYKGLKSL